MKLSIEFTEYQIELLFGMVEGSYAKTGSVRETAARKSLKKKLRRAHWNNSSKPQIDKFKFYSNTKDGKIEFVICVEGLDEGESEEFVFPLLDYQRWRNVSEDSYKFVGKYSTESFELAKKELLDMGFKYKGGIDSYAMV